MSLSTGIELLSGVGVDLCLVVNKLSYRVLVREMALLLAQVEPEKGLSQRP